MKIACLSGKGGAGKTFVAVNLAAAAGSATYIDCDVEEPNGHLFLKPETVEEQEVCSLLPQFDAGACTGCRECVRFCRFHALMYIKEKPMLFAEMCHSCGGCALVCPAGAVTEAPKRVGAVRIGTSKIGTSSSDRHDDIDRGASGRCNDIDRGASGRCNSIRTVSGVLDTGEASGIPVIAAALKQAEGLTVIDCPPGSACSVMESVADADFCVLVAEPTAFGFHNFKMVHELATLLGRKCGVVVNKQDAPFEPLETYCAEQGLEVLARIPYDPAIAASVADGRIASAENAQVAAMFEQVLTRIGRLTDPATGPEADNGAANAQEVTA